MGRFIASNLICGIKMRSTLIQPAMTKVQRQNKKPKFIHLTSVDGLSTFASIRVECFG